MSSDHGGSADVAALLGRLGAVVDELASVDLSSLSDAGLLDALRGVQPALCRVQAVRSALIAAVHHRGAAGLDGAASTAAWLRGQLHIGDAAGQVRAAAALSDLPEVAAAYARGDISAEHVQVIADVAAEIDPAVLAAGADKLLAEQAAQHPPAVLRRAARRIRDHFDPDAAERRAARLFQDRWLSVAPTFGGAVSIQGVLDPEGGALVMATLQALTPPPCTDDRRTPAARRADALVQACRLAGAAAPDNHGERPHVTVTVDWPTLQAALSASLHTPDGRWTGATMTPTGEPVHSTTARRIACDAGIIPAVLGGAGEPLDIGRTARTIPTGLRRALTLRDGGCRFPGCDRPASWTDGHHITHWADGGSTSLINIVLLCRAHHGTVHERHWNIQLDPTTGIITVHRPDGSILGTSHPRSHSP